MPPIPSYSPKTYAYQIESICKQIELTDSDIQFEISDSIIDGHLDGYIIRAFKDFAVGPQITINEQTTEHVLNTAQIPSTALDCLKAMAVNKIPALSRIRWFRPRFYTVKTYVTEEVTQTIYNVCPYIGREKELRLVEWMNAAPRA
jgi:hypothetical protein